MPFKPVDTAIKVIVGPAIDDTDFKAREEALTYDQAGIEVDVILEMYDGTIVTTAVTPTAAGDYDWAHTDQGYYELELPASGGASFNNTEEGIITVAVFCTGVLPFRSVSYDIIESQAYDALVKGTDALQVDAVEISGDATAANNAELAFDGTGYGFTGCTIPTVTTLTGHTAQTGDNFARIGATGSALTSLAQASICTETRLAELAAANLPSDIDDLLTRLSAARAGYLDNLSAGAVAQAATALLNTTWTDAKAGYLNHSVATIDTNVDDLLTRITAARAGYLDELAAANLPSDVDDLLTRLSAARAGYLDELAAANIPADIDTLITNVPDIISLANIRTQADNALIAINLDHLLKIAVDTNWATTVHLDSALGHMVDVGAAATFDRTTDSNEAIRNRGDAAWTTGAGGTVPSLLQNTTIATLATQVSFTLTAGSADDDAYKGAIIVITDAVTGVQKAVGRISDYTGASKTITLQEDPAIFTMAVGDTVDIIATDKLFIGYTDTRAGYLDELAAANMPSDLDNTYASALGNFMILSSAVHGLAALKTLINGVPTTAEFDARTLLAADYFDFTSDSVIVGTNNDKTGYALSNVGADLILKTSTFALAMADATWDEILSGATHNIATSAGRRVREIGAYAIHSGTAQGGNTIHITLAATASATDGIYNRNLLVIVGGTGAGQTRTIVDYVGSTKVALADREWRVSPDATSEYQIVPDDTPLVADHGLARAGTVNTIQLRTYASAVDSIYNGAIIAIIAGTGRGESRIVESYVGATRTATVCDNWDVTPDTTSVYVMMPYGMAAVVCIGADPLADIKTQADSALSDVNLDHLMQLALTVNDGAPNAADFITSSAVAIDDWYNLNMLLFTSGALAGLARFIDDYDGATKRIYLAEAFPQAPANTDAFVIVGVSSSVTTSAAVADAVWDELEAGHTTAGSFGEEVTKQGKKLDRNLILDL